ncbi:transforming protein [Human papillomavirus 139]|uniref:Protein E7 n=1 Tax=Human papillomavirus 139 TaxID=1070412 RepID=I6MRE2_9PAPI|nr:transforming protein [Human papillomavirus 139]
MHGEVPDIKDVILENLEDLILPANLLSDEDLSAEAELESAHVLYRIVTYCHCGTRIKFSVLASPEGIRGLELLLLEEVSFLCTGCSKGLNNGR